MKEIIKQNWNIGADSYNKSIKGTMRSDKMKTAWKQIFTEVLGNDKLKILDVGTGPGIVALMLAELGHDVTGVDFAEDMLKNAMKNNVASGRNVDFKEGDAEDLPFGDASFDAVVSRFVLWTVTDPKKAIAEWERVLKPGGKVVIVDGNWHKNRGSFKYKVWHMLSRILILITERKNPFAHKSKPVKDCLWSTKAKRPDIDKSILEQTGFKDICILTEINQRTQTMLEHLKYGYQGEVFLVTGTKT